MTARGRRGGGVRGFWRWLRGGWVVDALERLRGLGGDEERRPGSGARPPQGARRAGRRRR